jgi:arginyl-tRNA synthetase
LVQGEDGKKLKTRSGIIVKLIDLLNEAVNVAEAGMRERFQAEGIEFDESAAR